MASNFFTRLGQTLGSSIVERLAGRREHAEEAPPTEEAAPPAEAEAPVAEAPVAEQQWAAPEATVEPAPAEAPVAEAAPAPEATSWSAPAEPVVTEAPVVAEAPAAEAAPAETEPAPEVMAATAATTEAAPAAPEKSAEEIEEERLWAETDQAWAAGDFTRVTVLLDQLKVLQPEDAAEIDQKIAAAQYNTASELERAGDLERALFLYQDAQRRDPNLGEANFAVERVQAALTPPEAPAPEAAPAEQTVTVADGDTLSAIAERHYGDANAWPRIFEANRDQLDNPDVIHPGQVLRLP